MACWGVCSWGWLVGGGCNSIKKVIKFIKSFYISFFIKFFIFLHNPPPTHTPPKALIFESSYFIINLHKSHNFRKMTL